MNKFGILDCVEVDENGYKGPCVILVCISEPNFMLFFPVSKENSDVINYVLKEEGEYDVNTNVIGIYKTMIDSWNSSDRYLSGIIMDVVYDKELKDDVLMIRLALANDEGNLDSLVHVSFLHAILLTAMEGSEIIVGDKLMEQMMPSEFNDNENNENNENEEKETKKNKTKTPEFPGDKKIVDIARKIMSGKIKDS